MKRIRLVELLATIRANFVAFLSIAMFVCLGVGLFLGIEWGAVALRGAAQDSYDDANLHDVEIQFPYGLTDADIKKIEALDGVESLEAGYTAFATMTKGSMAYTLKFQSVTKDLDLTKLVAGEMPKKPNEAALLSSWAKDTGIKVGDTIKLRHDAASGGKDGMEYLTSDSFVVTGLVNAPAYLSKMSANIGVSNIGAGTIDCVAYVPTKAFDADAYHDGHTNVYVTCAGVEGLSTFSQEYADAIAPVVDEITELGEKLAPARYKKIHDEAQDKLDDAEKRIRDGERELEEGEQQIKDGEQQLAEGAEELAARERELEAGREALVNEQAIGAQKLEEAHQQLVDGQARYDEGLRQYTDASELLKQANAVFKSVQPEYETLRDLYNTVRARYNALVAQRNALQTAIDAYDQAPQAEKDKLWPGMEQAYTALLGDYATALYEYDTAVKKANEVGSKVGVSVPGGGLVSMEPAMTPDRVHEVLSSANAALDALGTLLDGIEGASYTVSEVTIRLVDIPAGLKTAGDKLASAKETLDASKAQLDAGWAEYNRQKDEFDKKVAEGWDQIYWGEQQLEEGKQTFEEKTEELKEGKRTLAENEAKLQEGKEELADYQARVADLVEYEWVITSRKENGGVQNVDLVAGIMDNVHWAMASLFIVVGLFVCYSAVSRLVHEQVVQIGTKKALGFREGQIASLYLWFSGLAVALGVALSLALAVCMVETLMNPTAYNQFCMPPYAPYVSLADLALMGGLELALILGSTWFAIHGMLRREALDLLRGESTANAKEHFYERTKLWKRMSLYSQTIVNNCVNDKRRMAGTLIGVIGCTALIVTAVTLFSNVERSFARHYDKVYNFDTRVYLSETSNKAAKKMHKALDEQGIDSVPAFTRIMQVRKEDGLRSLATVVVPTDPDAFEKLYHVVSTRGQVADLKGDGIWMNAAYGEHTGARVGDEVTLTEGTGKTHTFVIAGFMDYYLLRQEFVLSQEAYRTAFGEKPAANVMLAASNGADLDEVRDALSSLDCYDMLVDDYADASYAFGELEAILQKVVIIYLVLSALMALMVLLNLDLMFVDEKKKELIVLMICGFSAKDAKAYIHRDSIALTIIGILLGIVLGAVMGGITVRALEPSTGYFIKSFNGIAALVGGVGAGAFAVAVLLYSLRRIPRFDLTDINRF